MPIHDCSVQSECLTLFIPCTHVLVVLGPILLGKGHLHIQSIPGWVLGVVWWFLISPWFVQMHSFETISAVGMLGAAVVFPGSNQVWHAIKTWLVLWNMAFIFHILGISSSRLTFIFFRGVGIPPSRKLTKLFQMFSSDGFLQSWCISPCHPWIFYNSQLWIITLAAKLQKRHLPFWANCNSTLWWFNIAMDNHHFQ